MSPSWWWLEEEHDKNILPCQRSEVARFLEIRCMATEMSRRQRSFISHILHGTGIFYISHIYIWDTFMVHMGKYSHTWILCFFLAKFFVNTMEVNGQMSNEETRWLFLVYTKGILSYPNMIIQDKIIYIDIQSKKSPTGPTEWTPQPEYLIALATYLKVRWEGPIQFLMDTRFE